MNNTQRAEGGAIPWWWRPALAMVGLVLGLLMSGAGVELGTWLVAGEDDTLTQVWCNDENEYAYEEGEYTSIEHYRDEAGAWCQRTTETVTASPAGDWPLWLRVPLVIILAVLTVGLGVGGILGAVFFVYLPFTQEMTELLHDLRVDLQTSQRERAERKAERNG